MKSCWQIRQEQPKNGDEWRMNCSECHAMAAGASCWELNMPCCCAPMHVTCDFCCLYIAHRREIASRTQEDGSAGLPSGWSTG